MLPLEPMKRVRYGGATMNVRTRDMVQHAEKPAGFKFIITQGSYTSAAAASGTTHDKGGVLDFRAWHLTDANRVKMVRALKDSGFAAWYRTPAQGFDPHVHAVAFGDPELSPSAKRQTESFDRGRNGLNGDALDNTYRPEPKVGWNYKAGKPRTRR